MEDIKYVELIDTNFTTYRIEKDNILECNLQTKEDIINMEDYIGYPCDSLTNLVDSLLLVVENYHNIINLDDENEFDPEEYINQINIVYENDESEMAYVDMSSEEVNENQFSLIDGDKLYITIEDRVGAENYED